MKDIKTSKNGTVNAEKDYEINALRVNQKAIMYLLSKGFVWDKDSEAFICSKFDNNYTNKIIVRTLEAFNEKDKGIYNIYFCGRCFIHLEANKLDDRELIKVCDFINKVRKVLDNIYKEGN